MYTPIADTSDCSALYVIDLDRFRQIAAGDRLRQHYQGLSADPNSLANLDQDLPNNMYKTLPIVSFKFGFSRIRSRL